MGAWGQWSGAWGSGPNFLEITDYLTVGGDLTVDGNGVVSGTLRVNNAAGTASTTADEVTIGGTGLASCGISFLTTNTGAGYLMWGDSDNSAVASIQYQHTADQFVFSMGAAASVTLRNSGSSKYIAPFTDGLMDIGRSAVRWGTTYTDNIVLTTSLTWDAAPTYTRNATVVEDRTLLASASATATNNNNVLAALIADLQSLGILA